MKLSDLYESDARDTVDEIEVTDGIQAAEEAWAGGVGDFGDPEAAYHVQAMPGYFAYRSELEERLREKHGDTLTLYRSITPKKLEDWKNGADLDPMGFTTSKKFAESWGNFAGNRGKKMLVIKVDVPVGAIIMRGKAEEHELVVDANEISAHTIKVV